MQSIRKSIGLIGATNVGKSTLFNRLIGQFRAIVTEIAGTTQDIIRHPYDHKQYGNLEFQDSPGLMSFDQERPFLEQIIQQTDIVLFLVDIRVGITAKEQQIHTYIQQHNLKEKVILIVNKMDKEYLDSEYHSALADYYALGYKDVIGVSAHHGKNIESVWETIAYYLQKKIDQQEATSSEEEINADRESTKNTQGPKAIPLAIVGKPNAGKSTLLNTLAKETIAKVEDEAGTTLDYVSTNITYNKRSYLVHDTAGIRKKSKTQGLEKIAYDKTFSMLKYIRPVVIYLLDISQGLTHRDMTLLREIHNKALPHLIAVNKTDTVDAKTYKKYIAQLAEHLQGARYIPIVPLSGIQGKGLGNLFRMVNAIYKESRKKISTGKLNTILSKEFITRPPRFPKNKICKIFYATQTNSNPPEFTLFINHLHRANFSFKKRVENSIRKHLGFIGCPLVFSFRERKKKSHSEHTPVSEHS